MMRMSLGLDGKRRPARRYDTRRRDTAIYRLRRDGSSVREIAAALGCSVGTVHRVVRWLGDAGAFADESAGGDG
jgi:DNA-binding NarL/FixJ family response regulator